MQPSAAMKKQTTNNKGNKQTKRSLSLLMHSFHDNCIAKSKDEDLQWKQKHIITEKNKSGCQFFKKIRFKSFSVLKRKTHGRTIKKELNSNASCVCGL